MPFFSFLSSFSSDTLGLALPHWADLLVRATVLILLTYVVVRLLQAASVSLMRRRARFYAEPGMEPPTVPAFLVLLVKTIFAVLGILFVLSNLGVNVSSLVAGFGLGGIAIAFAAQKILGDVFSSFAIYFDKPFRIGDFIVVGPYLGTVLNIGLRSTRIRALSGEEVIIPNSDLTAARIQNFRRLKLRRVEFTLAVRPDATLEAARRLPELIRAVIEPLPQVRFDRAHCKTMTKDALTYEIVYRVESDDYGFYMDTHQRILLGIKERLDAEGVVLG